MSEYSNRRGTNRLSAGLGTFVILALAGAGSPASAQPAWDLEVRGGASIPAGDLAEVGDPGAGFGVGAAWWLGPRVALRVDGDVELMSEDLVGGIIMPKSYLWHYHGGLELDVPTPAPWRFRLRGGAGGTTYDTRVFFPGGDDFLDSYFSVSGGLSLGRPITEQLEMGVNGQIFVVFTEKDRTAEFAARSPLLNAFSKASSFPIQLYLRWTPR